MHKSAMFSVVFCSLCFTLCFLFPSLVGCAESTQVSTTDHSSAPGTLQGADAVLVIDVSGSMKQSDPDFLCRSAALNFIDELGHTPGSRAALITFSDTLHEVIPLTSLDSEPEKDELVSRLNELAYTSGDTDIGAAVERAVGLLTEGADAGRAGSIFLLTDGEIDLPAATDEEAAEKESLTRALMAVEQAKAEHIVIHSIALDLSDSIDKNLMNYMADSTGGTSSVVNTASALEGVFRTLSEYSARQSVPETEEEILPEETEAETREAETETEEETETETEAVLFVRTIGSVDGPVHLKGLLPGLCSASLSLSDLFLLEGGTLGAADSIRYTAYPDDSSLLTCSIEDGVMQLTGLKNGTCHIRIFADPAPSQSLPDAGTDTFGNYGGVLYDTTGQEGVPVADTAGGAQLSFLVEVDALIPSPWYLTLIPAFASLAGILFTLLHGRSAACVLSGTLQWYVRGENEKIFGMPPRTMADLADYGSKVKLSELVQDELLTDAPLHKVTISGAQQGILISSKSSHILIAASGGEARSRVEIKQSGQFKIFCETESGRSCVILFYTSENDMKTEPSHGDDSEERTRLLV